MKKMRKLMSLFLAFALVLGFTAPLGALALSSTGSTSDHRYYRSCS